MCLFIFGGAEGSRTPVRKHFNRTFSERSQVSTFPPRADTGQTARFSRVIMRGRGNSYPPHGRHINDAFPGLWPLRFRRLPLVRQRQQYDCCQLIFKLPVLWRSGAAARLSCLCTPVETGAAPYRETIFGYLFHKHPMETVQPHIGRLFFGYLFHKYPEETVQPYIGRLFFGYLFHKYPGETVQPHIGRLFFGICFTNTRRKRCSPFTRHSEPVTDVTGVGIRIPDNGERTATPVQPLVHNDSAGARPRVFAVLICGTGRPASPAQGTSRRGCPR